MDSVPPPDALDGLLAQLRASDARKQLPTDAANTPTGNLSEGVSYEMSHNTDLGLPGGQSFLAFTPFGTWNLPTSSSVDPQRSPLQEAFIETIDKGVTAWRTATSASTGSQTLFIDVTSLDGVGDDFFGQTATRQGTSPNPSPAETVIDTVNTRIAAASLPATTNIIIRMIWGTPDDPSAATFWPDRKTKIESIFWTRSGSNVLEPRIKHANTTLHVAFYNPHLSPTAAEVDKMNKIIGDWAVELMEPVIQELAPNSTWDRFGILAALKNALRKLFSETGISISWNHGKILAVGGKVAMTVGGNYWGDYRKGSYSIVDLQAIVTENAAISAHRYADYFWKYLKQDNANMTGSLHHCSSLAGAPSWNDTQAPLFEQIPSTPVSGGTHKALTVCQLGDWYGELKGVNYPVQIVDAMRDLLLNLSFKGVEDFSKFVPVMQHAYQPAFFDGLKNKGFSSAIWASRYARTHAIANATSSVHITNQQIVGTLQRGNASFTKIVDEINAGLPVGWDGNVWPYAVTTMSTSSTATDGVTVILSRAAGGVTDASGYDDPIPGKDIRNVVALFLKHYLPAKSDPELQKILDDRFRILRVKDVHRDATKAGTTDVQKAFRLHSKTLCVDRKLLYIGSDNLYPSYNEEHGIWVQDAAAINTWHDQYWNGLVERATKDV